MTNRPAGRIRALVTRALVTRALMTLPLLAGACSGSGSADDEDAAPTTSTTLALSEFAPEECVERGWAQEPLLVALNENPETPLETLPDDQQVRAMDIVIGCFDPATLASSFAQIQSPFPVTQESADCLAGLMVENQSGAAFLGFNAYVADEPPPVASVDLRSPTVAVMTGCLPPTAVAYGVVLQAFLADEQNGAVDRSCVERNYSEQADATAFWAASYDIVVMDQNIEPNNRLVYEPGFACVSFGAAYGLSVLADTGESLSVGTTTCIDQYLDQVDAVDVLITTGSNQALIDEAALTCLSREEKVTFGLEAE